MAVTPDPSMGINSWLEDELYRQYLHDRSAVDESWKHIFEQNGGGKGALEPIALPGGRGPEPAAEVVPAEWQPLRGAALGISVTWPRPA